MSTTPQQTPWTRERLLAFVNGSMPIAIGCDVIEVGAGTATLALDHRREVSQPMGIFHAGAFATLADSAATLAVLTVTDPEATGDSSRFPLAVQLSMNLISNTNRGRITATARVAHGGRTTQVAETRITDAESRLLALVTTTHLIVADRGAAPR